VAHAHRIRRAWAGRRYRVGARAGGALSACSSGDSRCFAGHAAKVPPLGHLRSGCPLALDYNYKTDEGAAGPQHRPRSGPGALSYTARRAARRDTQKRTRTTTIYAK
jgi:hypothetical protein